MTRLANVVYLSGGTLYLVELPEDPICGARLVSSWVLPQLHDRESFAGLSRGVDGSTLFHGSWISQSEGTIEVLTELVEANVLMRSLRMIPNTAATRLVFPVLSPSGTYIAATSYLKGQNVLALVATSSGDVWTLGYKRSISPNAWGASDDILLLTALDETGKGWEVVQFDLRSEAFRRLSPGGRPVYCPATGFVASLSSDHETMLVSDPEGSVRATFQGFFKNIVQWRDDTRLLYVTGVGYQDSLGIADVETGALQQYSLPSFGEIRGACYATGSSA